MADLPISAVRGNDSETLHLPIDVWGNLWCGEKVAPELAVLEEVDVRDVCAVCKTSKLEARRSGR